MQSLMPKWHNKLKQLQSSKETDSRTTQLCELVVINAKYQNRRRTMLMSPWQIRQPLPICSRWRIHPSQNRWWPHGTSARRGSRCVIVKLHYTATRTRPDRTRPDKVRGLCLVLAKFHYTGPTGPARTWTTRISEKLRWSVRVSDKVRAGPRGSARVRSGPCSGI